MSERSEPVVVAVPGTDGCVAVGEDDLSVRVYPNGPTLVRGADILTTPDGTSVLAVRPVVAVCTCGHSTLAPFCDGTHRFADARTRRN